MPINWDEIDRFTPELYELYQTAPMWEIDSSRFSGPNDYKAYWPQAIQEMVTTSKATIGKWQSNGRQLAQAVETQQRTDMPIFDMKSAIAHEPLPIAIAQIHERVALLSSNPPRGAVMEQQESQKQYVSALNTLIDMVFEANNYHFAWAKGQYNIQFWNSASFRWNIDMHKPGIFGHPGEITLERVDLDSLFFDPLCKELDCKYMDYIVQKHTMEYGEIQQQYPMVAREVRNDADELISDTSVDSRNNEDYIQSPQPKLARDNAGKRQKITVYEAWIRDTRTRFQPKIFDAREANYKNRYKTDKDGYLIGDWVPRYPNGRLIVVTRSAILKDIPNPYSHGQFPYVFVQGMPAMTPYSTGLASRIATVTRKFNNIIGDVHLYYQSEIKRPMHADSGAILDPNLAQQVPNDPDFIVELAPQKQLYRRDAKDIPPLVFNYCSSLQGLLDMVSGSSGVMRGNIADGAQLSAEALASLQQFASSQLALSAHFSNLAAKQLTYQLMWILRAILPEEIKLLVTMPDGTQKTIDWKSDRRVFERGDPIEIRKLRTEQDYMVIIRAGTGNPGAQQQQRAEAKELFNDRAIDREAFLDAIQYPNRQVIVERMKANEMQEIEARAIGKELGIGIGEQIKQNRPGRRDKS